MPTNTTSPGSFKWLGVPSSPPDNIQRNRFIKQKRINEIKHNANDLDTNTEYCFNEKINRYSTLDTGEYSTFDSSDKAVLYTARYSNRHSTDRSNYDAADRGTRYNNQKKAYYGARYGTRYGTNWNGDTLWSGYTTRKNDYHTGAFSPHYSSKHTPYHSSKDNYYHSGVESGYNGTYKTNDYNTKQSSDYSSENIGQNNSVEAAYEP